jgi:hypothetical protein
MTADKQLHEGAFFALLEILLSRFFARPWFRRFF